MDQQNQNQVQALAVLNPQFEVWQNLKLALVLTSGLINLYAIITLIVLASMS